MERRPAPLSQLSLGVKCGGSDGFSGISANPAVGYCSDLLVALKGKVLLAEFPELCGAEQDLIDRTRAEAAARKFMRLMTAYSEAAQQAGSGFHMNPSPGNIKDGLITDAIKSAGAAKKGGTSPVEDVLDYTEPAGKAGPEPGVHPRQRCGGDHGPGGQRRDPDLVHHRSGNADRQPGLPGDQSGHQQ